MGELIASWAWNKGGGEMADIYDVAAYILEKQGTMTSMKLQKLVYYSQAWSLVWEERPIFDQHFEAWANGPVSPKLYKVHRGLYYVERKDFSCGDPNNLSPEDKETIDSVLDFYGNKSSQWLSELTHRESPWLDARQGFAPGERCSNEITLSAMHEYYDSL
jgi:uncharacterized phage-associated protein